MTPRAVEMVPILHPAFARVRIANEIRMQFRRERKSGQTVSLQETLEADGDSALTLADVIQDGFCMEECCEKKADLLRVRQLLETLPARERQILLFTCQHREFFMLEDRPEITTVTLPDF